MDNDASIQHFQLSPAAQASLLSATKAAEIAKSNIANAITSLAPFQEALALQRKAIEGAVAAIDFSPIISHINSIDASFIERQNALAREVMASITPTIEASKAISQTIEGILKNFQVSIPTGALSAHSALFSGDQFTDALAGVSERILSGEIPTDLVIEAEELTSDVQLFISAPNAVASTAIDLALLFTSARVLSLAIAYIFLLSISDREIDFEGAVFNLLAALAGKYILEPAEKTIRKNLQ